MKKTKEIERLRGIVFEGAPIDVSHAAMSVDGLWTWFYPIKFRVGRLSHYQAHKEPEPATNQPETFLNWQDTLIER